MGDTTFNRILKLSVVKKEVGSLCLFYLK